MSQPGVLLRYLRMAVWPHPLVFDYAWPPPRNLGEIVPALVLISLLVFGTIWALRRRSPLGFLGAWWFLILAPTSSIIPLADRAFEHRLYLPLASMVALIVCAGYRLLWSVRMSPRLRSGMAPGIAVVMILALGQATIRRNWDYRSDVAIWADTVGKRPSNPRAHHNLGKALASQGVFPEAIAQFTEALRLTPHYEDAHYNLGLAYAKLGRDQEAMFHYREALRLNPHDRDAVVNVMKLLERHSSSDAAWSEVRLDR